MLYKIICFFVGHKDVVHEVALEAHPERDASRYVIYVLGTLCIRCGRVQNNTNGRTEESV